jgi:3-oxochol-4-en-24-oyl-CoA dehydrogenase
VAIAITGEQLAIQDSVRAVAERAGLPGAVRALEPMVGGDWRAHWDDLVALGLFGLAVPERLGGVGGSLVEAASALEQAAEHLLPGPVLPTVLAALALTGTAAEDLVPRLVDGRATAGFAVEPGTLRLTGQRVSGSVDAVLGAHDDANLLLPAHSGDGPVWVVLEPLGVEPLAPLDFSRPLARVTVLDAPARVLPAAEVGDLAATLLAAEAAGIARWCLRTAVDHAGVREQFGRPIGAFQAVKHLCAEMLCRAEQAGALAWDAARAPGSLSAPAAAAVALDAAVANAKDCVQVLGGIGFTWEHDAHLYLRRALAARQIAGRAWRGRVADRALAGERRRLGVDAEDEPARRAVRAFVADLGGLSDKDLRARLAESGYLVPHWPRPYGLDASPRAQLVIDEELTRAGVERPELDIGAWAVPTILRHGTPRQRERFALPTLRGELRWCQLFSEPDAGSDLAALRTRARKVDGGWRLDGQKVWTSQAERADWAICLARTDPDVPRHAGITYFLVDMRAAGITTRPLREITGEARFNEVFLDDVFVPADCVVGEVGGGWRLARGTLATERVAIGARSSPTDRLLELAAGRELSYGERERLGELVSLGLAMSLVDHRETVRALEGGEPGAGASVRKLLGTRLRQDIAEFAVELLGPAGAALTGDTEPYLHELLLSRCLTIAGGTTQVLLNLVGERVLGLPRER